MPTPKNRPWRILIVDDEDGVRQFLAFLMRNEGFEPVTALNGEEALAMIRRGTPDLVLLDINMPGMTGFQVLQEAKKIDESLPVIMVTACTSIGAAVETVKSGAYDYVTKPFENEELLLTTRRALEAGRLKRENRRLRARIDGELSLRELMGTSESITRIITEVERVAPTDFTVVLTGETGSGKELVARAIHRCSKRAGGPFIPVDCGAIQPSLIESELFGHEKGAFTGADRARPGKFEAASGGTLFLDEIQNLPLGVQNKFLRSLQEKEICPVGGTRTSRIDIRVVAASNLDLPGQVEAGHFRQDLYHRLNEFGIALPPLRCRREDILFLAKQFLDQTCLELGKEVPTLDPAAAHLLLDYSWPGNVRELRNVIRRAVLLAERLIEPRHLGIAAPTEAPLPVAPDLPCLDGKTSFKEIVRKHVARVEREILVQALHQTGGNKAKAARILQIDYKTIQSKTREYGITPSREAEPAPPSLSDRADAHP